jgi:hypothetical protein
VRGVYVHAGGGDGGFRIRLGVAAHHQLRHGERRGRGRARDVP